MKKLLFIAAVSFTVFACDAPNQSSERGAGSESEEHAPADPVTPGDADPSVHSDTTNTGGTNRETNTQYDTIK